MAKLAILATLFAGMLAVAMATATTRTTVVTITEEEGNPQLQSCQQEMQKMGEKEMRPCMQYMSMGRSWDASFRRSAVGIPRRESEQLEECCMELKNMNPDCRCMAIKQVMRMAQQQHGSEEMMGGMMERAENLPQKCGWRSPTQCSIRAVFL